MSMSQEWIPVKDQLPMNGTRVWAYFPDYPAPADGAFRPCIWRSEGNAPTREWVKKCRPEADVSVGLFDLEYTTGWHTADQISHWMLRPLPKPPISSPAAGSLTEEMNGTPPEKESK